MYVIEFRVYTANIKSLNKSWKENYLIVTKIALHFSIESINRLEYVFSVLSSIVKSFHIE